MTLAERLMAKTVQRGGCWLWTGTRSRSGYGKIKVAGKMLYAHRVAYELFVGPVPPGCTHRHCVNPAHLEPVTPGENRRRSASSFAGVNAAKTYCDSGHPFDAANTYIRPNGNRSCRACNRAAVNRRARRRVAA